jgi:Zn-dependent oligopeptidase
MFMLSKFIMILSFRRYQASLLGFDSFAAMSMETKMAGSVEAVKTMIASLLSRGTLGLTHR